MSKNPVAVVTGFAGQIVVGLIVLAAISVFVFGYEPKPCPRHICFPQNEIVTVEQMIRDDPARFDPAQSEARRAAAFERNRQASRDAGLIP